MTCALAPMAKGNPEDCGFFVTPLAPRLTPAPAACSYARS